MALRPQFEETQQGAVIDQAATDSTAPKTAEKPPSDGVGNAVAKAANTAVGVARKLTSPLAQYRDQIPVDALEGMGNNTAPAVIATSGKLKLNSTTDLGTSIVIRMLSYNERLAITPGVQDDDEANKFFRSSYDGKTIPGETLSVAEYVQMLKDVHGYTNAATKLYMDVWGYIVQKNGLDISEEEAELVRIQLSPESVKKFKWLEMSYGSKQMFNPNLPGLEKIEVRAEDGNYGKKSFTYMSFHPAK